MSQDHTNDSYSVILLKMYGPSVTHCIFAIRKSTTIAATSANVDFVGVALVIRMWPSSGAHGASVAPDSCRQRFMNKATTTWVYGYFWHIDHFEVTKHREGHLTD